MVDYDKDAFSRLCSPDFLVSQVHINKRTRLEYVIVAIATTFSTWTR